MPHRMLAELAEQPTTSLTRPSKPQPPAQGHGWWLKVAVILFVAHFVYALLAAYVPAVPRFPQPLAMFVAMLSIFGLLVGSYLASADNINDLAERHSAVLRGDIAVVAQAVTTLRRDLIDRQARNTVALYEYNEALRGLLHVVAELAQQLQKGQSLDGSTADALRRINLRLVREDETG